MPKELATATSYTHTGCVNNRTYQYAVRCIDEKFGSTSYFNTKSLHYYRYPINIKVAKYNNSGKIKVTWSKVSGASKYRVYYKRTDRDTSWKGGKLVNTNSFIDTGCVKGKTYVYTVRACDKNGKVISSFNPNGVRYTYK